MALSEAAFNPNEDEGNPHVSGMTRLFPSGEVRVVVFWSCC
jgi:hypothetical protein